MYCCWIKLKLAAQADPSPSVKRHLQGCVTCAAWHHEQATQTHDLALRAEWMQAKPLADAPSPEFFARLAAQIRNHELAQSLSWESGIIAMQRWLVAFSAVVLLLLALVGTLLLRPTPAVDPGLFTTAALEETPLDPIGSSE